MTKFIAGYQDTVGVMADCIVATAPSELNQAFDWLQAQALELADDFAPSDEAFLTAEKFVQGLAPKPQEFQLFNRVFWLKEFNDDAPIQSYTRVLNP